MNIESILAKLKTHANPANVAGMAHFGINAKDTLGVSIPILRNMAKEIGKDHALALNLWDSGIHEARILAALVADPKQMTEAEMEYWVKSFDSWDVCDQVCSNLFDKTGLADKKASEWANRPEEFVRRAGFVIMAARSVHDKKAKDETFERYFPLIEKYATDERNFVRKAVNWALRQMGKRNATLNKKCIQISEQLQKLDSKSARWIAKDALRELRSPAVQAKVSKSKP
jgi:3-methyladenine DNA glycosylase AlkD